MLFFGSNRQRSKGRLDVMLQHEEQPTEFLGIASTAAGRTPHSPANAPEVILNGQGIDAAGAQVGLEGLEVLRIGLLEDRLGLLCLSPVPHQQRLVEALLECGEVAVW